MDPTHHYLHHQSATFKNSSKRSQNTVNNDPMKYGDQISIEPLLSDYRSGNNAEDSTRRPSAEKEKINKLLKHDCSEHLKRPLMIQTNQEAFIPSKLHRKRNNKSFYYARGGSEKGDSDTSDPENMELLSYTPMYGFDEKSRNTFRQAIALNLDNVKSIPLSSPKNEVVQATPKPRRFKYDNFNQFQYHSITSEQPQMVDFNLHLGRKKAKTTIKKKYGK